MTSMPWRPLQRREHGSAVGVAAGLVIVLVGRAATVNCCCHQLASRSNHPLVIKHPLLLPLPGTATARSASLLRRM